MKHRPPTEDSKPMQFLRYRAKISVGIKKIFWIHEKRERTKKKLLQTSQNMHRIMNMLKTAYIACIESIDHNKKRWRYVDFNVILCEK